MLTLFSRRSDPPTLPSLPEIDAKWMTVEQFLASSGLKHRPSAEELYVAIDQVVSRLNYSVLPIVFAENSEHTLCINPKIHGLVLAYLDDSS